MRCSLCNSDQDKVIESRILQDGEVTRRRRECVKCGYRSTTYERMELAPFMVIKRRGFKEPFCSEKVLSGLIRAFEKRPQDLKQISSLTKLIEEDLRKKYSKSVTSLQIGEAILEKLRQVDDVAYIRFASVCKKFESINEFIKEIQSLTVPQQGDDSHGSTKREADLC